MVRQNGRRRRAAPSAGKRCRGRRGFTLIELIVVIALIILLLTILSPGLYLVSMLVVRTGCQMNERGMGTAMLGYTADNDSYFPGHVDGRRNGVREIAVWPTRMRLYAGGDVDMFWCPAQPEGFRWRRVYGAGPPDYAAQIHADEWGYDVGEKLLNVHTVPFSYGYNDWGAHGAFVNSGLGGDMWSWPYVPLSRVVDPGNMIAVADTVRTGSWDFNIDPGNWREYPSQIHDGGAEFLFADGHSEWISQADATNVFDLDDPEAREMNRRWNNSNQPERY